MTDDDSAHMIEDCEDREERLTDWERGFIASIKAQIEGCDALTEKQADTLEGIWERVTAER
jgi:hypothetical protein